MHFNYTFADFIRKKIENTLVGLNFTEFESGSILTFALSVGVRACVHVFNKLSEGSLFAFRIIHYAFVPLLY